MWRNWQHSSGCPSLMLVSHRLLKDSFPEILLTAPPPRPRNQVFILCQISSSTQTSYNFSHLRKSQIQPPPQFSTHLYRKISQEVSKLTTHSYLSASSQEPIPVRLSTLSTSRPWSGPPGAAVLAPAPVAAFSLNRTVSARLTTWLWPACRAPGVPPHALAVLPFSLSLLISSHCPELQGLSP